MASCRTFRRACLYSLLVSFTTLFSFYLLFLLFLLLRFRGLAGSARACLARIRRTGKGTVAILDNSNTIRVGLISNFFFTSIRILNFSVVMLYYSLVCNSFDISKYILQYIEVWFQIWDYFIKIRLISETIFFLYKNKLLKCCIFCCILILYFRKKCISHTKKK